MKSSLRALLALLSVLVLAFGVAACGGGEDTNESQDQSSDTTNEGVAPDEANSATGQVIQADPANEGKEFTVGSKNFAEQYVLGEIYAQALEAAGFTVEKQLDLGSEQVAFRQLKRGQIDGYPEYSGTALTSFYRVPIDEVPRDPNEAYEQLVTELEDDQIVAGPQTPFQNTYKVTSTKETAEQLGNPKTMTELVTAIKESGEEFSLSGFPECRQRTDCLLGINETYNWDPEFISSQGQYSDLDSGQADFTMGFSTDGPLSTDKYVTYEDDKSLFPPYYVAMLINEEGAQTLGESGMDVIAKVQEPLTEEVMQELNSRVVLDKQEPEQVAADYLREAGFVEGGGSGT